MTNLTETRNSIRIGGGSAFFNDRLDGALELVEKGNIDVLMLETMAERTLTLLHVAKRTGGNGYFEGLERRLMTLLPALAATNTKLVTNAGGADPVAAAHMIAALSQRLGLRFKIAVITGDDVSEVIQKLDPILRETGEPLSKLGSKPISSNAYLGAESIAAAYSSGAEIILTGRTTDSALALGPIMSHFGWKHDDLEAMACGVVAGHLLECGAQSTGGYFAEPGFKDVPDLHRLGFPIAEVLENRSVQLTKPEGSGGCVDRRTVTEQMLYEVHDPAAYLTPDVTLDLRSLAIEESDAGRVTLTGAVGHPPPEMLKVLIGIDSGFLAEIEISYMGLNCEARARLAIEIIRKRTSSIAGLKNRPLRCDLIGMNSLWPRATAMPLREVRVRIASSVADRNSAEDLVTEVESLYVNGPSGGGGVRFSVRPTNRTYTAFLPRSGVNSQWFFVEH